MKNLPELCGRHGERLFGSSDGLLYIFCSVSCSQKRRFKLRRGQIDSVVEHGAEEAAKGFGVALGGGVPIRNRAGGEEPGEHGSYAVMAHLYSCIFGHSGDAVDDFGGKLVELGVDVLVLAEIAQR